jgi:chorismate mutase / prephenate dehydrogenase
MKLRLKDLRAQLDEIDEELLSAAARRQQVVAEIGRVKAAAGISLFDRTRERVVFDRARDRGRALGLGAEVAESLYHVLVEASHDRQQEDTEQARTDEPRSFLLMGGAGEMGVLLTRLLRQRGHAVDLFDLGDERPLPDVVSAAQIVMVCVPMDIAVETIHAVGPHMAAGALLCDINSLKRDVCDALREATSGEAMGTHPMFGPTVGSLRRQKVVLCPVRPGPLGAWWTRELGQLGAELITTSPEDHDRMMAIIQVLVHFHTIVMGDALRRTGVAVEDSLRFTSPIYRVEMSVVGRLFGQDPRLYAEIEMQNPYGAEVIGHFMAAAEATRDAVQSGDRDGFCDLFGAVSHYFRDFSGEALELSDFLIEAMVKRV